MAHFAELDQNNKVLKVVVACNTDIANNGGEQSLQASEHFKTVCPLSENGIKWVQTSYNNNFRKYFASTNMYYDETKDKFILNQPYASWTLDFNDDWQPPITEPDILTIENSDDEVIEPLEWNEDNLRWEAYLNNNKYYFDVNNNFWKVI